MGEKKLHFKEATTKNLSHVEYYYYLFLLFLTFFLTFEITFPCNIFEYDTPRPQLNSSCGHLDQRCSDPPEEREESQPVPFSAGRQQFVFSGQEDCAVNSETTEAPSKGPAGETGMAEMELTPPEVNAEVVQETAEGARGAAE